MMARWWVAYLTIVRKEVTRFMRIWIQTLLPPAITMTLYFLIFGSLVGTRIGTMDGHAYIDYIAPGIVMMSVITSAYANVVSSFFGAKFQKHVEELLVAPVPNAVILAGFVTGGVVRGLIVGLIVTAVALCFTTLPVHAPGVMLLMVLLAATLFSLAGFINGIYARSFDDTAVVPTFVLTPLTYLGGVFYSIDLLPPVWRAISHANPVLYMVNAFRFGFLGTSDVPVGLAVGLTAALVVVLGGAALALLARGTGIRT